MSPVNVLVGLANPGKAYAGTRHNAGAWWLERIAELTHTHFKLEPKFHGLYTHATLDQHVCHLLIPTTYMNLSGKAVQAVLNYRKFEPSALLVAHDDIDLPVGTVKLKLNGGDGGHNGLKDIIRHLHTKAFYRLRIGVGRPTRSEEVVDYVLHPPSKAERQKIDLALDQALTVLPLILAGKVDKAMQELHTQP